MTREFDPQFGPFRLDLAAERLTRGDEALRLRAKSFALLRYLVERPGRLLTKQELLDALWPDIAVGDAVLTVSVSEIRDALGDDPQAPRFIETVHRRGYRFIGGLRPSPPGLTAPAHDTDSPGAEPVMVGREDTMEQLLRWLDEARRGGRRTVFVTGEPGIGKTAVVDAFLRRAVAHGPAWIVRGQCVEHHGVGEPYLPILDALGRIGRGPARERVVDVLAGHAPTWLRELPGLVRGADRRVLEGVAREGARERMLRELADAVSALAADRPLVFLLEDLHWSDHATLDAVAWLARRPEPEPVLLLGTYRPVEVVVRAHPLAALKRELALQRRFEHLPLELLTEAAVARYLAARCPSGPSAASTLRELARAIHRRTGGHPLFMVTVVDHAVRRGWLIEREGTWQVSAAIDEIVTSVPESLREMIEQELEQLAPDERRLVEAGSVAGVEFSAAAVAAGLDEAVETIDERCARLARRQQFLASLDATDWPDGTVAGWYAFRHSLQHQVVYERLAPGLRRQLHQRIGDREEAAYGQRAGERAGELARHFEEGRDHERAITYHEQAARNALARNGYHEAANHLVRALRLLERLPEGRERTRRELDLQAALGRVLMVVKGFAALEVGQAFTRAEALGTEVGDTSHRFAVRHGRWIHHCVRGEMRVARALAEEVWAEAERAGDPVKFVQARVAMGVTLFYAGELSAALTHLEEGMAHWPARASASVGVDPGLTCRRYAILSLWLLGHPDRALEQCQTAVRLARERDSPPDLAAATVFAARLHQYRGEPRRIVEWAETTMSLSREYRFAQRLAAATILRGWARAAEGRLAEGMTEMREAIAAYRKTGAGDDMSYWLALQADIHRMQGDVDSGMAVVIEALAQAREQAVGVWEPELHRLRGELLRLGPAGDAFEAEACFREALRLARAHGARSLELRAASSLVRCQPDRARRRAAGRLLAEAYSWFTEGFDTSDLAEARSILEERMGKL